MAIGDPSAYDRQKKIDQMRMGRGNKTLGPLRQVTQDAKGNTTIRQNPKEMAMPTVLPKPISIERSPEYYADRDQANEYMNAMRSQGATVTPASGVMRDRAMAIPTAVDQRQAPLAKPAGPPSYNSFSDFMKSMGK